VLAVHDAFADRFAKVEFAIIRECLIEISARMIEHLARIRVQLPEGALFRTVALSSRRPRCALTSPPARQTNPQRVAW
jgi:hypothetical protein